MVIIDSFLPDPPNISIYVSRRTPYCLQGDESCFFQWFHKESQKEQGYYRPRSVIVRFIRQVEVAVD